jgi:predicted lysophospholipase L1 biosynthesis ABC-type transport system permease subunit
MRAGLYLWRATAQSAWRTVLAVALIGGLFGAVALGAVAGARRTASAYGRYLASTMASNAFVNVPGLLPGMSAARPIKLIEALPGITASDAIELGAVTLRQLGKKVGDTILVGRRPYRRPLTISGVVTLPSFGVAISQHVSLGQGAMLSEQALLAAEGLTSRGLQSALESSQAAPSAVAIDLVPGTSAAQRAALVRQITSANPDGTPGGTYALGLHRARAAAIVNATQMGGQPLALALGLAAAAMASLALTVLTSVRRRRRELALLKTLGMTRRQLRAIVAWQTTLTLVIALVVGVPLGVAAGRWAWHGFAGSIGVAPVTVVPALLLAAGCIAVLLAGNLLTSFPAAVAARTPAAGTLRAE